MWSNAPRPNALRIYLLVAALLLAYGLANLWAGAQLAGGKYGGFLWIHDLSRQPPYYVGPMPWRTLYIADNTLHFVDTLVQIDGQPVESAAAIYAAHAPGDLIPYLVRRNGALLTIAEPLRIFTLDMFLLIHGLLFLVGLSALGSGWELLRPPRRPYLTLVAFGLLPAAGSAFFFVGEYSFLTPNVNPPWAYLLFGAPAPALIGGCFLYAALLYPEPAPWLQRFPRFLWLLYALPLVLVAALAVTEQRHDREGSELLIRSLHALAALYFIGIWIVGFLTYRRLRRAGRWPEIQMLRAVQIALLWLVGSMFVLWLGPFMLTGKPLLPYEVLAPFLALLPLVLVYGLRNGETLRMLNQELLLRRAQAEQIDLLRRSRDRTLHQVADRLHDYVLPELRGSQLLATHVQKRQPALAADSREDLGAIVSGLQGALAHVQSLVEGAKPLDWSSVTLQAALDNLVNRSRQRAGSVSITLDAAGYDEADSEAAKDACFAVAQLALDNALRHAGADTVRLLLRSAGDCVTLEIRDNGRGFTPEAAAGQQSDRRHLGLANMRQRAAEIGAILLIESSPQEGACVELTLRRPAPPGIH